MRLTRRGYAVAGVVVLVVASGAVFGPRGLNAIAAPGAVALAYAGVQVWRLDRPAVDRSLPRHGPQGSTVAVELAVDADRPFSARVIDEVGRGLEAVGNDRAITVGTGAIEYEVTLRRRGDRTVGPATVVARDVLGLVSRRFDVPGTGAILVRPPVTPLSGPRANELVWTVVGDDRQEFDTLRHYRRGDPLRDIHWPTSAKIPDEALVVKSFRADEGATSVHVVGESDGETADQMAAATASVAVHLLEAGLRVGLVTADGRLDARSGGDQRSRVLDALARCRGGSVGDGDRRAADVIVDAGPTGVTVEFARGVTGFNDVAGRPVSLPTVDGTAASPAGEAR